MSRQEELARLSRRLLEQRSMLNRHIASDLGQAYSPDDGINDLGETAHQVEQSELHMQLASMESKELVQIEGALARIRQGTYGTCERCSSKIPVARLHALPFSALCVGCQEQLERRSHSDDTHEADWSSAIAYERRSVDRDLNAHDFRSDRAL